MATVRRVSAGLQSQLNFFPTPESYDLTMKNCLLSLNRLALLGALLLGIAAPASRAQDAGPLLDLLVKKGTITDQEAEDLRTALTKDFAATPAGKLNLSSPLTELRFTGDVRIRYEDRVGQLPPIAAIPNDRSERERFRYRLRFGVLGKLLNDWSFGLRLETGAGSRSSNVTMGDDGGPFNKTGDVLNVGQIYATWTPSPMFSVTAGRMPNPFVTTPMVWDADINPEGFAEQLKYRDGKNEFSATFAQFMYSTGGTQNAFGVAPKSNDIFMLGWQFGYKRYVDSTTTFFQITPVIYSYANLDRFNNPAAFNGVFSAGKQTAINDLLVLDIPVEYDWLIGGVPVRVFGDYAVNLDGDESARKFAGAVTSGENTAYTLGAQYGKAANRGEWDVRAFWQSVGAFALDPNLVDSDIFDSRVNMQGLIFNFNYALGAATQLTLTYGEGRRKNESLIAAGAGDIATVNTTLANTLHRFRVLQIDLNIKF